MVTAILQARMSSRRLPGKVMADLVGAPMIERQIERLRRSRHLADLVVATSEEASDDTLSAHVERCGLELVRGPLDDVLGRFILAISSLPDEALVMRLTADCPLVDPTLIDRLVESHRLSGADYSATTLPDRTFPKGLDAEIFSAGLLRLAAAETDDPYDREHVTPFIYRRPQRFRLGGVTQARDEGHVRWTVDTPDDLAFVRGVYAGLYRPGHCFDSQAIRIFVAGRPDLIRLGGEPRL